MSDKALSRRALMRGIGALGCSAAAFPLMTGITLASAPWDTRLVVIVLRGAMDGLDLLRPEGDPEFFALRSEFDGDAINLGGFFSLNTGLADLLPLWQSGDLAFAHAVSTPYRDGRSHFDGQNMLEAGLPSLERHSSRAEGWLNRLLQVTPGIRTQTGFAIGRDDPLILQGNAAVANWAPSTDFALGEAAEQLLAHIYHDDPLFRDAAAEAVVLARSVNTLDSSGGSPRGLPERQIAEFAAQRMLEDTRIVSFSLSGWDTHRNQQRAMRGLLARLADTILTIKDGLGDTWSRTAVLAVTEFGRTVRVNGSNGTDHGTGGAMLMAGGAIRGGQVYGRWPGLTEADLLDRRDLMPTEDVRAYAGRVMQDLMGLETGVIERVVFPGLSIADAPRVIL